MSDYVLVTGASSGIGRQIAVTLSEEYPLILNGRNETRLRETAEMCARGEQLLLPFDLADPSAAGEALRTFITERGIFVQAFVHAAGISPVASLRMLPLEAMRQIMDVNFFVAAELLKVLSHRKTNKKVLSRVVFISSLMVEAKGHSIYCASKGALNAFMRAMAEELSPQVRLNCVLPGRIHTAMTNASAEKRSSMDLAGGYLLDEVTTQNIAYMTSFLLSERSCWITGQKFTVDDGRTAH